MRLEHKGDMIHCTFCLIPSSLPMAAKEDPQQTNFSRTLSKSRLTLPTRTGDRLLPVYRHKGDMIQSAPALPAWFLISCMWQKKRTPAKIRFPESYTKLGWLCPQKLKPEEWGHFNLDHAHLLTHKPHTTHSKNHTSSMSMGKNSGTQHA